MLPKLTTIHKPTTLDEAVQVLRQAGPEVAILAGGARLLAGYRPQIEAVVDISDLGLAFIEPAAEGFRIGAGATLAQIAESSQLRDYGSGILSQAALASASSMLRERATLGGTLHECGRVTPLNAALLALDARVVLHDPDARTLPLADFYARSAGDRPALISELHLPSQEGRGAGAASAAASPADRPLVYVSAALGWAGERARDVRIAVAGLAAQPMRLPPLEAAVEDRPWQEDLLAILRGADLPVPPDDARASGAYRQAIVPPLARRALEAAWKRARR